MARTKTKAFWERMRDARGDTGYSLEDVGHLIRDIAPAHWRRISRSTISRLEQSGAVEASADPVLLQILALIYRKDLAELSPLAARDFAKVCELPAIDTSDMCPYRLQFSFVVADDLDQTNGTTETWMTPPSSTPTVPLNAHEACPPRRFAATARNTRRSRAGLTDAA